MDEDEGSGRRVRAKIMATSESLRMSTMGKCWSLYVRLSRDSCAWTELLEVVLSMLRVCQLSSYSRERLDMRIPSCSVEEFEIEFLY